MLQMYLQNNMQVITVTFINYLLLSGKLRLVKCLDTMEVKPKPKQKERKKGRNKERKKKERKIIR